ncbi:VOC family protein [Marinococcus sp. PL1-022]|jgi:catechol 2,3-dioxygenase-like lactoylglutathione lyase family enzyme|uniref:VOC family protein n=1 Tax=Marinococcus sp. PL1-022 TaxID=3095363 RepID=UPI002618C1A9|nr:VOC family protein [Marinococcus sp. PL1-022]MDX6151564.1 VOC family protein [Marinococcus sp. PL1-022]
MIGKIASTAVYVEDQQRAKEFWTEKIGFEVRSEDPLGPNAYRLEVAAPGAETTLAIYPKSYVLNWQELKPSIVFECDNVHASYQWMKAQNIVFDEEPTEMNGITYASFRDEDDNVFLLKS